MRRSLYRREPLKAPDIGIECPACHGRMEHQRVPCTDKRHSGGCATVHFGYRCNGCGGIIGEEKILRMEQIDRWKKSDE